MDFILKVFCLKKRSYWFQPFIYLDSKGKMVKNQVTDKIKWIDKGFEIQACSLKKALKKAKYRTELKHSNYKGGIKFL